MSSRTLVGTSSMTASAMVSVPMNCAKRSAFSILSRMTLCFLFGLTGSGWVGWIPESPFPKVYAHSTYGVCDKSSVLVDFIMSWLGLTLLAIPNSGHIEMTWGSVLSSWTPQIPLAGLKDGSNHTLDTLDPFTCGLLVHNRNIFLPRLLSPQQL